MPLSSMSSARWFVRALPPLLLGLVIACGGSSGLSGTPKQQANQLVTQGIAAQNAGRTSEAKDDYTRAIALDPTNKYSYYDLGVIQQSAGDNVDAEKNYRAALQLDPNFESALYNLAIIRTSADKTEAETLYRHVISIDPNNAAAHLNLGFLLLTEGRATEAGSEFAIAIKLKPALAQRIPSPLPIPKASPSP